MYEISGLFVYKFIFTAELILAETLFTFRLKKKPYFVLRLLGALLVCFGFVAAFPIVYYNAIYSSFMFTAIFVVSVLLMKFIFYGNYFHFLFCGIAAYTIQHLSYAVYDLIIIATGLNNGISIGIYGEGISSSINGYTILVYFAVYSLMYWLSYQIYGRRIRSVETIDNIKTSIWWLSLMMLFVDVVLNAIITYRSYSYFDMTYVVVLQIYNIISCIMAISIQFNIVSKRNLEIELEVANHLRQLEEQQYTFSKETIDTINLKCHDIRHQIRKYGKEGALSQEAVQELEQSVNIYDSVAKTGSKALDIILTEKSIYCAKNKIELSYIINGKLLDFMEEQDIYSLFGNIMDNAIDANMKLEESKRNIGLFVKQEKSFILIQEYNCFVGSLKFENGLPSTNKEDKRFHGYGVKSIENLARKYNGNLTITAENNKFEIRILFGVKE